MVVPGKRKGNPGNSNKQTKRCIPGRQSLRASISYKQYFNQGQLNIKSAYLDDYLHYQDPDTIPGLMPSIRNFKSEINKRN